MLSRILTDFHRGLGTNILTGADVTAFETDGDRLAAVLLAGGARVAARAAVVGVGAQPCDELAAVAGIAVHERGGIIVDAASRTNVPGVLAIGDVTVRPWRGGERMRFESIPSAVEQAEQAAATVLGREPEEPGVPWSWSDQASLKLKTAGVLSAPFETIVRGDPASGSFALFHHDGRRLIAAECSNASADFMAARRFLSRGGDIDLRRLADPSTSLRELALAMT